MTVRAGDERPAEAGRRAVTRWTARLRDAEQERRYRATRLAVLRRDVQVVAGAVLAFNAWSVVDELASHPTLAQGLLACANNALLLAGGAWTVAAARRAATWRVASRVLVLAVVAYAAVAVTGVATGDTPPQEALLLTVVSAAVLHLHAQLPLVTTAALALGWTALSTAALAFAVATGGPAREGHQVVSWSFFAEGVVLLVLVNLIGLASSHRGATGERMLFAEREATHRLSTLDPLTDVANRRRWEEHLAREWERCAREQRPVSLLLVDVDGFKSVNDRFGHAGGDQVLQQVALLLGEVAQRPGDLVARLGGDEFAVLLPATGPEGAGEVAQRVLSLARALRARSGPGDPCSLLTLSVGADAALPGPGVDAAALEATVDALLYRAKSSGRDRAVTAA